MNADSFFKIGGAHLICQDFAHAGLIEQAPISIISDGCSSAKESDWGARLLVKSLQQQLELHADASLVESFNIAGALAENHCKTLQLPEEALTATLLSLVVKDNVFKAAIFGDGCIVGRHRSGYLKVIHHEFTTGAPYYLRYKLNPNAHSQYQQEFGQGKFVTTQFIQKEVVASNIQVEELELSIGQRLKVYDFPVEDYDLVAIISDGVKSFTMKQKTDTHISTVKIELEHVLNNLFNFKGYAGNFVQRRCQKAFKEFDALGWTHYDDFSIGAIHAT